MTKQEKIQEAYGEYWDLVKDFIDENGFCHKRRKIMFAEIEKSIEIVKDHPNNLYPFRPKSLQGIEDNNGWIKIENNEVILNDREWYFTEEMNVGSKISVLQYCLKSKGFLFMGSKQWITHYQPIQKPKPPIY